MIMPVKSNTFFLLIHEGKTKAVIQTLRTRTLTYTTWLIN